MWTPLKNKSIGKRNELLIVTCYLTGVYFLTMNTKVLNTRRGVRHDNPAMTFPVITCDP